MSFDALTPESLSRIAAAAPQYMLLLDAGLDENLEKRLHKVDPFTHRHWIYEGTDFDSQKERGPLLVQVYDDPALFRAFSEDWRSDHLGVFLTSPRPVNEVLEHFRTLRKATMPNDHPALLRLHEPRTLRGFAEAYEDDQDMIDDILGPVAQVIWCEWHGDAGDWYILTHSRPEGGAAAQEPLRITQRTRQIIENQRMDYTARCIAREVIALNLPSLATTSALAIVERSRQHAADAYALGFTSEAALAGYIDLAFRHGPSVRENGPVRSILIDTETPAFDRLGAAFARLNEEPLL